MKEIFEKIIKSLSFVAYYLKWPYFLGFALLYSYIPNADIALHILWFISAVLIAQELYKKYKAEKARKEENSKE